MTRVLEGPKRLCDGLTRRDLLRLPNPIECTGRRPRSLVAVLLGRPGRRRNCPGPGDRPIRQDRQRPGRCRVSPRDILATIYHLLGIDPSAFIVDRQGRPMPIIPGAEVLTEALA